MKHCFFFLLCLMIPLCANAQYSVSSPNMSATVDFKTDRRAGVRSKFLRSEKVRMTVMANGKLYFHSREIGLEILSHGRRASFGKSDMISGTNTTITISADDLEVLNKAGLKGRYRGLVLESVAGILLEVVVFNNGMAYRFSTTGFAAEDEYKILNVTDVFPDEHPNGILGTFKGNQVFPWRTMLFDEEEEQEIKTDVDEWENLYPHTKVVSWKDALRSASIGLTTSWISGKRWGNVANTQGISADFTYKHLYGGLSFSPCQQLLYVFYEHDFDPLLGVMGAVHSRDVSCRFGYNLPIQNGYDIWSFAPYATATYLYLHQHGKIHPTYHDVEDQHHYLVGLGLKAQYQMRQRITFGLSYEYQVFTGRKEPHGRNTFIFSMGYGF